MTKIESILVKGTLKQFYESYKAIGTGVITSHKGGDILYNLMTDGGKTKIDLPDDIKKKVKEECIRDYPLFYSQYDKWSNEKKKELFNTFYKSSLVERKLNDMLKVGGDGQIIDTDETIVDILGFAGIDRTKSNDILKHKNTIDKLIMILQ